MVDLVYQRGSYDCGVACLAMMLGRPYEYAEWMLGRKVGDLKDPSPDHDEDPAIGVTKDEFATILYDHGYATICLSVPSRQAQTWYDRVGAQLPAVRPFERLDRLVSEKRVVLLGVDSMRSASSSHWIVGEGWTLYDPQPEGQRYKRLGDSPKGDGLTPVIECLAIVGRLA